MLSRLSDIPRQLGVANWSLAGAYLALRALQAHVISEGWNAFLAPWFGLPRTSGPAIFALLILASIARDGLSRPSAREVFDAEAFRRGILTDAARAILAWVAIALAATWSILK